MRSDVAKSAMILREARLRAGLSQIALAERSGKDRVQIGRYESGAVAPSVDTLSDLIRACGFELVMELAPPGDASDEMLSELQQLSPERRVDRLLDQLDPQPSLMPRRRQPFDPRAILAALDRHRVDYVLIGGLAQVIRGADITTTSVDICPSFAADNLDRLTRAAQDLDAAAVDGEPTELTDASLAAHPVISLATSAGTLRVVGAPEGAPIGFVDLRRAATKEHLGHGVQPVVASVGDLARMASALHRDQDLARLTQLRRIVELEARRPETISRPSEPTLRTPGRPRPRARRLQP